MTFEDRPLIEHQSEAEETLFNPMIRIPRAAQARLLLHGLSADSPFMDVLNDTLPDEATRLAYLNHLAWQARS